MKNSYFSGALKVFAAGILLAAIPSYAGAPPAARFVPTRFTVADVGTVGKPDVVLIPGLSSPKTVWDAEAKLLAPNYRVHILQIKGIGSGLPGPNATGPILPGLTEELHRYIVAAKIHPVVVGHTLGGLATLMLAFAHPEDVAKIVVIDALPFYPLASDPKATPEAVAPQARLMRDNFAAVNTFGFQMMLPDMVATMVTDDAGTKAVMAATTASNRRTLANAMYEDFMTDLRADTAKIATPALVLYPFDRKLEHDPKEIDAAYKNAYADMPDVKLARIDGSRQFIMYDQPDKLDAALEDFLK